MLYCVLSSYGARGKFGEHERSVRVRVAHGDSRNSTCSFLSALQTSHMLHNLIVHS